MTANLSASYGGQGFSFEGQNRRFTLPLQMRKLIAESSGKTKMMFVAKHDRWPCLIGYGRSYIHEFSAMLDRQEELANARGDAFDRDMRAMQLHSFMEVPFDASGRFVLPEAWVKLSKIDDRIFFQGNGDFITLWAPKELYGMGPGFEGPQAVCAGLEDEAEKARK